MEITIYGKRKKTATGQMFIVYLSRVPKKDGSELPVTVKFETNVQVPQQLPCNIVIEKSDAHLSSRKYRREDTGEEQLSWTLWISRYGAGSPYVDHSMDDVAF